jgi:hypothetical protein
MSARSLLAAATVVLTLLFAVPAAHATLLDLASCPSATVEHPFSRWLDPAGYVLVPDGGFESKGRGWRLDGAGADTGNESFFVHNAADRRSLTVPAGASATTPATCLSLDRPTLRFIARRNGPSLLTALRVEVLFADATGAVRASPVGLVAGGNAWSPTLQMTVIANLVATLEGAAPAAFRFTALGGGWQIDDVYVDPYVRH